MTDVIVLYSVLSNVIGRLSLACGLSAFADHQTFSCYELFWERYFIVDYGVEGLQVYFIFCFPYRSPQFIEIV